ncbi:ROK family protein [Virgibacillus pantothenticus]|uniref:ROK family protein n=1 Tax=Virgibacillus pantothenticus TaxID=1473 RepID=UPI001BCD8C36|nr:ROK family protein [Virgibacillus pantothenticus]MBU8568831.1 ROK family protein [Virgibacillus pantothenticus]MBU8602877.1 ROK family protein [Virgibacillus pantothenticus]MBU8636984.1 ROK family protein [Virgibacillus pantothenticus]MBU8644737.1 ROK family protein [Virgibacillus pantothenticus]MBU8648891.1 ROK family protein [Virgibacillus pantothenticus]
MDNLSFKHFIRSKFDLPCAVYHDGKAAAVAELWLGELREVRNGAAITLGTGIGGGLILNHPFV